MDWMSILAVCAAAIAGWILSSRFHAWRHRPRADAPARQLVSREAPRAKPAATTSTRFPHVHRRATPDAALPNTRALDPQARRHRIRDRYVAVRFSGALHDAKELNDAGKVIKAARLYFEDENGPRADELLQLAVAAQPQEPRLWRARLEILFLRRDAAGYAEAAHAFRRAYPDDPEWESVVRLGRALAPSEPLFRRGAGRDESANYGPWPNTPNWIEAPWDLTAEVAGADFHHRMRARLERDKR